MQVPIRAVDMPSRIGRALVAIPLAMAISFGAMPAPAHAITRPTVIKRANHWIKTRVMYSQRAYHRGYRRDCSGFVSMAWRLKRSYTSSTIRSRSRKISWRKLKPGDAVRRSGHVAIFGGWKNKKHRRYWALEESSWGKPAHRRVKTFKRGYSALRFKGIKEPVKRRVRKPVRKPAPVVVPVTPLPIPSGVPTSSIESSAAGLLVIP